MQGHGQGLTPATLAAAAAKEAYALDVAWPAYWATSDYRIPLALARRVALMRRRLAVAMLDLDGLGVAE